nr:uncharacterized protein LOC119163551 isoform X2 [Rhipicephalus microplus]
MDAGPILRDIMMGHFLDGGADGGDSIFSDIEVCELSPPTTEEERGGAQYESAGLTPTSPTRSSKSRRQSRPNYAALAGDRLWTVEACESGTGRPRSAQRRGSWSHNPCTPSTMLPLLTGCCLKDHHAWVKMVCGRSPVKPR